MPAFVIALTSPEDIALGSREYANRDVARRAARRLNDDLARLGLSDRFSCDYALAPETVDA